MKMGEQQPEEAELYLFEMKDRPSDPRGETQTREGFITNEAEVFQIFLLGGLLPPFFG